MKFIRYALALALLSSGGLFAETAKPVKGAKYKKIEARKKQTQAYARKEAPKKAAQDRYGKPKSTETYKKIETATTKKHEKGLRKPTTKPAVKRAAAQDRPAVAATKTEPSMIQKAERWLGLGAAGAAATKAVSSNKQAGYHTGPRNWDDKFGYGVTGFYATKGANGEFLFAGHPLKWWLERRNKYPWFVDNVVTPSAAETLKQK